MSEASVWPSIVGTAIGGILTIAGGVIAQWMSDRREHLNRSQGAASEKGRRGAEFQQKTLLNLQREMRKLNNAASVFYQNARARDLTGNDLVAVMRGRADVFFFSVRVADDVLREEIKLINRLLIEIVRYKYEDDVDKTKLEELFNRFQSDFIEANHRLGVVLRALWA